MIQRDMRRVAAFDVFCNIEFGVAGDNGCAVFRNGGRGAMPSDISLR
jgi:hypothetical protein